LALARTPQMPAVLTESAYMILPDEEAFLKTEKFQCECAEAMLRGLKDYARDMREPLSPAGSPANKKR
jgi:N-acetylmuramoyl-L-alanine amidase